ncbi:MAG: DUF3422 family protein [Alphaproteobacteria bacterium]|nr:DUF3422 family protein [Alphaproteobacteria bacterium]
MGGNLKYRYSDQYSRMGGEAHKRGAFAVGAPALSWHLGLFAKRANAPDGNQLGHSPTTQIYRDVISNGEILQIAEEFFSTVLDSVDIDITKPKQVDALRETKEGSKGEGPKTAFFSFDDILTKFVVTPHSDHFTITTIVDLSKPGYDPADPNSERMLFLKSDDGSFRRKLVSNYETYAEFANPDELESAVPNAHAHQAKCFLQDHVWDYISKHLLRSTKLFAHSDRLARNAYCLEVFADFRGVVVNCADIFGVFPTERKKQPSNLVGSSGIFGDKDKQSQGLRSLFPLMDLGDRKFKYKELVACTIFRNRAVYLSPLGAAPVHSGAKDGETPMRPLYFGVATCENNRWQIGRIIHRLNSLGTLRLIALRDYEKLQEASDNIRIVGEKLDELFLTRDDTALDDEEIIDEEQFQLATLKREIDEIGRDITGHLPYRVSRSRYRTEQFKQQLADLHVGRIEAWQPYDEFVKRRLYPAFDFIDRVGERYKGLGQNYERQLLSLNSDMQSTSGQHLVEIQKDVLGSHAFQHVIESIALGYYGGLVFYYITKPYYMYLYNFSSEYLNGLGAIICTNSNGYCEYDKYYKSLCMLGFGLWAMFRYIRSERAHKEKMRDFNSRMAKRTFGRGHVKRSSALH